MVRLSTPCMAFDVFRLDYQRSDSWAISAPAPRCLAPNSRRASPASGDIAMSVARLRRVPSSRGENPAINRCRQVRDRTARRGHAAFVRWCPSAAPCCPLRSELRSPGGSPAPCMMAEAGALDPQKRAILVYSLRSVPRPSFALCCWCRVVVCVVVNRSRSCRQSVRGRR